MRGWCLFGYSWLIQCVQWHPRKPPRLIHTQWLVECKWIVHAFAHGLPVPSDQVTKCRQKHRGDPWCKKTMNYTAYPRSGAFNSKNSGTKMDQTWATLVHLVTWLPVRSPIYTAAKWCQALGSACLNSWIWSPTSKRRCSHRSCHGWTGWTGWTWIHWTKL